MSRFLALNGVRFMMLANDPTVLDHMRTALTREIENRKWQTSTLEVFKPGGMGHQADLEVSGEYIQAIGRITEQMTVSGFLIELNMKDAAEAEMKRRATEFKNMMTIRRGEVERMNEDIVHMQEETAQVIQATETYKDRGRHYTVTVLQRALDRMRDEVMALQGRADALNQEIAALEANMNGTRRSELRNADDKTGSPEEEPLAYSIGMNRLKNQAAISRTRLNKVIEDVEQLRESLAVAERNRELVPPAIPDLEEPNQPNREGATSRSAEESAMWWKDFLTGRVTRLKLRPREQPKKTNPPEEMRREIELLERQERLLQDTLARDEQAVKVAEEWLKTPNRDSEASPFAPALKAEQSVRRILDRVPQTLWDGLGRRFPDQRLRSFNLRPSDVAKQLLQSWERSDHFGKVLEVLDTNGSFNFWFLGQESYLAFKTEAQELGIIPEFDRPGEWVRFQLPSDPANYSLVLAERNAEYLLRGFVSGDCTNCGPNYNLSSFLSATATHIADPGILNFKLLRNGEWIGNIYALVLREADKPVLVVDAIQIPWQGGFWGGEGASPLYFPFDLSETHFPVKKFQEAARIAAGALLALSRYAETTRFQEVWLSSFVSNFHSLQQHFSIALKPEVWDREVTAEKKVGDWRVLESLGYQGRLYVESIANPQARLIWPHASRAAQLARMSAGRSELRAIPGIGKKIVPEERPLIDRAIEDGWKSAPNPLNEYLTEILSSVSLDQDLQYPGLFKLISGAKFELVAVKSAASEAQKHPSPGLGLDQSSAGNDLYSAVRIDNEAGEESPRITIYVGHGIYELASDAQKRGMILHGFYLAYRSLNETNASKYPIELDLELLIDRRIAARANESAETGLEDAKFPGFESGGADRKDLLVRARTFAGLFSAPTKQASEEDLAGLLKTVIGLAKQFSNAGLFGYAGASVTDMLEGDKIDRLMAVTEYVGEHRREDLGQYLDEKIAGEQRKDILVLNSGAPTPWILTDVRKIVEHLAQGNRLRNLYLDLPPALQPDIDQFLESGNFTRDFSEKIAARFPPFLPKEFQRPDLYEAILRAVYIHNQDTVVNERIKIYASYEPPDFPKDIPFNLEGGELPKLPGMADMPDFGGGGMFEPPQPWQPAGQEEPGGEIKFPGNVGLPQMPQQSSRILSALLQQEAAPGTVTLLINPMEELIPEELSQNPRVASILHIDRYTGFGPQKEVNQLALFMSEGGGPKQTFALPIYPQAPFYNEAIHAGVPAGMPFNLFRSYRELIMSTADEGGDKEKEVEEPAPFTPETSPVLVPAGSPRSELRQEARKLAASEPLGSDRSELRWIRVPDLVAAVLRGATKGEFRSADLTDPKVVISILTQRRSADLLLAKEFSWLKFETVADAKLAYDFAERSQESPSLEVVTRTYQDFANHFREMREFLHRNDAPGSLAMEELINAVLRIEFWKRMIEERWSKYGHLFSSLPWRLSWRIRLMDKEPGWYDLNRSPQSLRNAIQKHPNIRRLWELSGADYFKDLIRAESALKGTLREKLAQQPGFYKKTIAQMYQGERPFSEQFIWWLFGISHDAGNLDSDQTILSGDQREFVSFYMRTDFKVIQWFLKQLAPGPDDVFYDLGSGFGEVVLYAALATPVRRAVGIELSKSRTEEALRAKKRMGIENVELIQGDVRTTDLSDGSIFYLFNPFGNSEVEETVVEQLKAVAREKASHGKTIRIAALHGMLGLFRGQPWLDETANFERSLVVFTSRLDPAAYSRAEAGMDDGEKFSGIVAVAREAAEKTLQPGLPRSEMRRLLEQVAPEEFQPLNQRSALDRRMIQSERAFLETFFTDNQFRREIGLEAERITDFPEGRGRVILSIRAFENQPEIFKALVRLFTLEPAPEENGMPAPYIFAGKTAGMLKAQLENKQSGLNALDQRALRQVIHFVSGQFSEAVTQESTKAAKSTSLILSASENEAAPFLHKILAAIESQDSFFDPQLTIEQNASAYYVRARLLKRLAGELDGFYRKASRLKRTVSDQETAELVSNFFRQNLGITLNPKKDGFIDLSLSTIHARLEIFRQANERIQQAA